MPKTGMKQLVAAVLATGFLAGCTTGSSFVNYDESAMYSGETAGNIEYLEIGSVEAGTSGFFWRSCSDMVNEVSEELQEEARQRGGNAIIAVGWRDFDSGEMVRQPSCTTGWGWFSAGVVGGFHPWVKRSAAEGIAVYANEEQLENLRSGIGEQRAILLEEAEAEAQAAAEAEAEAEAEEEEEAEAEDDA